MHRLEITGATPDELYFNAIKMLSVLLKGGATIPPAEPAPAAPSTNEAVTHEPPVPGDTVSADGAAPKKRGRPKVDKAVEKLNDEIPDLGVKTGEVSAPKELTLDGDIRPRLREIQQKLTAAGLSMEAVIARIVKELYGPFGIAKADQLKPEQYAEFLENADVMLQGEG